MRETAAVIVGVCWAAMAVVFGVNHVRVSRRRAALGAGERNRTVARQAMVGLMVEALGFFIAFGWPRKVPASDFASMCVAAVLAPAATAMMASAVKHLGEQWRIQAVVTDEHRLVTSGPYALVRHPIYGGLLGMLFATGILVSGWTATLVAAGVYVVGTEIRVRAEDALLARHFGAEFDRYGRAVKAYVPFVR